LAEDKARGSAQYAAHYRSADTNPRGQIGGHQVRRAGSSTLDHADYKGRRFRYARTCPTVKIKRLFAKRRTAWFVLRAAFSGDGDLVKCIKLRVIKVAREQSSARGRLTKA
jgi:hypothetical protein